MLVSRRICEEFEDGRDYYKLEGMARREPADAWTRSVVQTDCPPNDGDLRPTPRLLSKNPSKTEKEGSRTYGEGWDLLHFKARVDVF